MQITKFINLTPHDINIMGYEVIPASGTVCRIIETEIAHSAIEVIPIVFKSFGEVEGLPSPGKSNENGVVLNNKFLVSLPVLLALRVVGSKRTDVFAPDTGKSCIRENGQIKAVTQLIALTPKSALCDVCKFPTRYDHLEDGVCPSCLEGFSE